MTSTRSRIQRSSYALAFLCYFAITNALAGTGVFERFVGHVHQAFWCAVIEFAVLAPTNAITHLSERLAPRMFRYITPFVTFFWTEFASSSIARWVQLFIVNAALSPFKFSTGTASALGGWGLDSFGALSQGISFLCIIQLVYDINSVLRTFQAAVGTAADDVLADTLPFFGDPADYSYAIFERLIYVFLAGQSQQYGFIAHIFATMALYLERMAVGTFMTTFINAYNTLPVWRFCIFAVLATSILSVIPLYVFTVWDEAEAEDEAREFRWRNEGQHRPRARRQLPAVDIAIPREMFIRVLMHLGWAARESIYLLVRSRYTGAWRWLCPEFAALWTEDDSRQFYAAALTEAPASAVAVLVDRRVLRRRDYADLWRSAGLTTGFVLGGEAGVGVPGGGQSYGMMLVLGKIATILVRGLETVFGVCVGVGGIALIIYPR